MSGSAILFIEVDQNGHFQLTKQGQMIISKYSNKNVSVICISGPQRSGKSFLANAILKQMKGFVVGHSVQPCTKGIWAWSDPIELDEKSVILVLDCEGLYSTIRDNTFDAKIFTLSIMISSVFVYNQLGHIDEKAIENMSLIINLGKSINANQKNNKFRLQEFCPSFFWVLRDFSLDLKNQTPNDYLLSVLQPQSGDSIEILNKNTIRQKIKQYFPTLECHCLCRPLDDENELAQIEFQNYDDLRKGFKQSLQHLLKKVFQRLEPIQIQGIRIDMNTYGEIIQSICQKMNENSIPEIYTTLERFNFLNRVQKNQQKDFIQQSEKILEEEMNSLNNSLPLELDELSSQWIRITKKIKIPKKWNENIFQETKQELKQKFESKLYLLVQWNRDKSMVQCSKLLNQFKIDSGLISNQENDFGDYWKEVNSFVQDYNQKAKGPYKCDILIKNIFNIIQKQIQYQQNQHQQETKEIEQRQQETINSQTQMQQRLKNQIKDYESYISDLESTTENLQQEINSLTQNNEQLLNNIIIMENSLQQHSQKSENQQISILHISKDQENLQNQIKLQNEKINLLQSQVSLEQKQNTTLKNEINQYQDLIEAYKLNHVEIREHNPSKAKNILQHLYQNTDKSSFLIKEIVNMLLHYQKQNQESLTYLQEALDLEIPEAYYIYANIYEKNPKQLKEIKIKNEIIEKYLSEKGEQPLDEKDFFKISGLLGSESGLCDLGFLLEQQGDCEIWYKKAIEKGSLRAMNNLGKYLIHTNHEEDGVKLIRKAGQLGYLKAQYNLGLCYKEGRGVSKDLNKARQIHLSRSLFAMADRKGDLFARMANALELIDQNQGDFEVFEKLMSLKGRINDPQLDYHIGQLYENGRGVQKDYKVALGYYQQAAENNYAKALNRCGDFYLSGYGCQEPNEKIANKFYDKALQLGDIDAMLNLGAMAENRQDVQKALEYYGLAAQNGSSWGHFNLGIIYQQLGQTKNAIFAFQKAKELGHTKAQEYLLKM